MRAELLFAVSDQMASAVVIAITSVLLLDVGCTQAGAPRYRPEYASAPVYPNYYMPIRSYSPR